MSVWGSLQKDIRRMCPSSPRQTWSSNLNHTASELCQVANQRADQRVLLLMASKRLESPSQVGQKAEPLLELPQQLCHLICVLFKSLFSPVARTLFRQRKWAVSSPESCVKDNFNLNARTVVLVWWTNVGFPWFGNLMLRFGVLPSPSVDVAYEEWLSLHAELLVSPNATNEAA